MPAVREGARHDARAEGLGGETSCCGMAGSFGYEAEHYDVSMKMAELALLPAVRKAPQTHWWSPTARAAATRSPTAPDARRSTSRACWSRRSSARAVREERHDQRDGEDRDRGGDHRAGRGLGFEQLVALRQHECGGAERQRGAHHGDLGPERIDRQQPEREQRHQQRMQHELERRALPARGRAGADRELRDEQADGEQGARAGAPASRTAKRSTGSGILTWSATSSDRQRDRPDERAPRHAGQRPAHAAGLRVDEQLQADDGEREGNDVGRHRRQRRRQARRARRRRR